MGLGQGRPRLVSNHVRRQLLDVLVNFFSAPRRRVRGEPLQQIGDLGVVRLRLGAAWRRRRVQCQAHRTAACRVRGRLGAASAAGCPRVLGAAGTCRARRTAACATFASTRARGSLRPVLTGIGIAAPALAPQEAARHTACGLPNGSKNGSESYVSAAASCAIRAP